MVTITASYIVTPNQETPKGSLWLSPCDQVGRWSHTPQFYIYKGKPNDDAIERMRVSLSKILVYYYPLAGRLNWSEGGRLELDCNAKGVMLFEAESTKSLAEYGDFSPKEPIGELIPKVDYSQPMEELPLLLVQLTRFHGDEGAAVGIAISHPLGDGFANIPFYNSWAKLARGDTLDPNEMPFLDRTVLKSPYPPSAPRFDHPELRPLPRLLGSSKNKTEQMSKTTFALLKLTSEQVVNLKKKANVSLKEGSRPYSKFEVISAHIWRCVSKVRVDLDKNQPNAVRFYADIRNRVNPPLPRNYFGNALAVTVTPTCYVGEIISKPLSYASQMIREAVERLTNEYIRSQFDVIMSQENLDSMRHGFFERGAQKDAPSFGYPNLSLTSWMGMPLYEADFGWGKPMYFGPGAVSPFDRAGMVLSPEGDGSVIVSANLQMAHMQHFIKFFWEDIQSSTSIQGRLRSVL